MNYLLIGAFVIYLILHVLKAKWQALLVGLLIYGSVVKDAILQAQNKPVAEIAFFVFLSFFLFMFFNSIIDVLCGD